MKSNKRTIILLVLLGLVGAAGIPIIKGNLSKTAEPISEAPFATDGVIKVLEEIQNLELNIALLESPKFRHLYDFSLPLVNIPIGRVNPFAPFR